MISFLQKKVLQWVEPFVRIPTMGFDISDRSIKYVKFSDERRLTIASFGEITIPEGAIVNGEILAEGKVVEAVKTWRASAGRHAVAPFVIASLPEEKSFVRLLQLPKVKIDDIGNAIRWEIEANIPIPPEELLFDYEVIEPLKNGFDHLDILVVAFPKTIIESYVLMLKHAGLDPVVLELESQAIARAVLPLSPEKEVRIIVDMGHLRTSFSITCGGAILFTTTIELGGKNFEENIARALAIGPEKAIEVKKTVGLNKGGFDGKVFFALAPAVAAFTAELKRTIEYHEQHIEHMHGANAKVGEVILTGGDANLLGFDTYLAANLRIPVRRGDPLMRIRHRLAYHIPPIVQNESLQFTAALGLAMRVVHL